MKVFNFLFLVVLPFLILSCKDVDGNLEVIHQLKINKKTLFGNTKQVKVEPGEYRVNITPKKSSLRFRIENEEEAIKFTLKNIEAEKFPRNGRVYLSADDLEQPFAADLEFSYHIETTQLGSGNTSCVLYYRHERQCRTVCVTGPGGRRICEYQCQTVPVPVYGVQSYTDYRYTEDYGYEFEFLEESNNNILATFNATRTKSGKKTEYGNCH